MANAAAGPGAGFEYPVKEVTWLKREVLLFANSIGCTADELQFLYVCQNKKAETGSFALSISHFKNLPPESIS